MKLSATLPERLFELAQYGLIITIKQITDARGAVYSFWTVTYNGRTIKTGVFEREHSIPVILKHIADTTSLRTDTGDMLLRSLTWTALNGCEHVPARELRVGDRMILASTTAHTVESITERSDGMLFVEFEGPLTTRRFPKTHLCNLISRGPQP